VNLSAHMTRLFAIVAAANLFAAGSQAAEADWQFEKVHLTNGAVLRGLILDETAGGVRFQNVRRQPGRPTVVFTVTLTRGEIAAVERLPAADRDRLKAKLKELEDAGPVEKARQEQLELERIEWDGRPVGWRYRSELFLLESDAPESIVRRAAGRLEQVYAAYARYLPPRGDTVRAGSVSDGFEKNLSLTPPARTPTLASPTVIELFQSRTGYEARLKSLGRQFVNVACYDPATNRILCYSDLERLGADLDRVRREHQKLRGELDKQEKEFARLYRGSELNRMVAPLRDTRKKIDVADRQNEGVFDESTRRLFAVLSHEAFHAYLASVVYPPPAAGPPRWLNEGLAQIFETAVVEAGELRVGHADRDRLARAKELVRKKELVPLARLLRATPQDFLAAHAADRSATDVHYLTAWAIAYHLTFERRLLGTTFLERYFQALARDADPEVAFAELVGQPVSEYEAAVHRYLLRLQPDGTLAK
jgi:hypothetical protein